MRNFFRNNKKLIKYILIAVVVVVAGWFIFGQDSTCSCDEASITSSQALIT